MEIVKTTDTREIKYQFVELARAAACMLITNSHFDGVYPLDISFGGCPGNCLFFLISGFLLTASVEKSNDFGKWYWKKLFRIYLSLTIVNLFTVLTRITRPSITLFLFPIYQYWYIPAIVILYAAFYIIMKFFRKYRYCFIAIDLIIYALFYLYVFDLKEFFVDRKIHFLILYGFIAMIIGAEIYTGGGRTTSFGGKALLLSVLSMGGFLIEKLLINAGNPLALKLQFLTEFFSMMFAITFFLALQGMEEMIIAALDKLKIKKLVWDISGATLEIYLVQYLIIDTFKNWIFPINFLVICTVIVLSGYLLHSASNAIYRRVTH